MTSYARSKPTNVFVALISKARRHGIRPTDPPRPLGVIATELGVSRQTIYNAMDGTHTPRPHVRQRIAEGLSRIIDRPVDEILAQLDRHWCDVDDLL